MEKRKKVALVLSAEPQRGGEYQYTLVIAECLKELSDSYFELVAVCTDRYWIRWCRENHVRYVRLKWPQQKRTQMEWNLRIPIYSRVYSMYMTEIGKLIRKEKIDVLFITDQFRYIPNLTTKIILPVHDLMHRYEPQFPEVSEAYFWRELVLKCEAKYADYILTDSKLGKQQFRESYLKRGKKSPYIVSLPYIVPKHIWEISEEPIEVPDKYVFYPAQFWKHKNNINLIKAIQILKESIDDIHLVLTGSEKNCYKEIKRYISENNLQNNITIKGFVTNGNMTYLYRHAVGLVMPSYFGPTNIPPLEAMALGCPVAVSDKYAMPEQVGRAGLLFDPDSPEEIAGRIQKMWTDDELRKRMTEEGYRRIRQWTQEDFKNRLFKVMDRCLQL